MKKRVLIAAAAVALGGLGLGAEAAFAKGSDTCWNGGPEIHLVNQPVTGSNGVYVAAEAGNDGAGAETATACYSTTAPGVESGDLSGGALKVWLYPGQPVSGGFACFNNPLAVLSLNCGTNYWAVIPSAGPGGVGVGGWLLGDTLPDTLYGVSVPVATPTGGGTVGVTTGTPCAGVNTTTTPLCGTTLAEAKVAPGDVKPVSAVGVAPTGVRLGQDTTNKTVSVTVAGTPASVDTTDVVPTGTCVGVCPSP